MFFEAFESCLTIRLEHAPVRVSRQLTPSGGMEVDNAAAEGSRKGLPKVKAYNMEIPCPLHRRTRTAHKAAP